MIKYGGAAMRDDELREAFATDVVLLKYVGMNPVIVHGGGPGDHRVHGAAGDGGQVRRGPAASPTSETVEVAKMVLLGKINSDILTRLNRHGQPAVGLGRRGRRAVRGAARRRRPTTLGLVGEIERVNVDVIDHIADDYVPVIASVGTDREGRSYNVNADEAAGKVAAAMRRAQGDLPHRRRRLARATRTTRARGSRRRRVDEVEKALKKVEGGMRPKLAACVEAIGGGVEAAHIIDGRRPHSLLLELFTDAGIGTKITA